MWKTYQNFASFCPHFSIFDAEIIRARQPSLEPLSSNYLVAHGFQKAAHYLDENKKMWELFEKYILEFAGRQKPGERELLYWDDARYPWKLRHLGFPPSVLFVRGNINILSEVSVSIVGARHPTQLGRDWVKLHGSEIAKYCPIVSGGARGIDSEAHWAALQNGGKTVAFLPGSVDEVYPSTNQGLFDFILETGGALVSEFAAGTEIRAGNFHRRNRLIAGLAHALIVVEAGAKSGTLMTANKARDENVEVFVVPGSPLLDSYFGSNALIRDGAQFLCNGRQVIDYLLEKNVLKKNNQ